MAAINPGAAGSESDASVRHIQRVDPSVTSVVAKARHTVAYVWNHNAKGGNAWEKENVEGGMYIVRRSIEPKYALVVINKTGTGDVVYPLKYGSMDFESEFKSNFFVFRSRDIIRALWIQQDEVDSIKDVFLRCESEILTTPPTAKLSTNASDILSVSELREALLRLINNDQFMLSLHGEYVSSEQRKRSSQQPMPSFGPPVMVNPAPAITGSAPFSLNPMYPPPYMGVPHMMPPMPQPQPFVPKSPYKPT